MPEIIYICKACGKPFEVPQGSQRKFCPVCLTSRVTAGRPPKAEKAEKK